MSMVAAAAIGGGVQLLGGVFGALSAGKAAKRAAREKTRLQKELNSLEASRQAIINPYEGVKDVSGLATNLSGMITNPFASLGVATQAAEFEAEQIDISLANTLDTLKETGAGAGGATALAQAALQSKKGISANIEQQEAANEKLRAQGEQQMEQMKMAEAQRIQGVQIGEAQRVQEAEARGKQFVFETREGREISKMNRVAAQLGGAAAQEQQARSNQLGAITGALGGIASVASSYMSAKGTDGKTTNTTTTGGAGVSLGKAPMADDAYNPSSEPLTLG